MSYDNRHLIKRLAKASYLWPLYYNFPWKRAKLEQPRIQRFYVKPLEVLARKPLSHQGLVKHCPPGPRVLHPPLDRSPPPLPHCSRKEGRDHCTREAVMNQGFKGSPVCSTHPSFSSSKLHLDQSSHQQVPHLEPTALTSRSQNCSY